MSKLTERLKNIGPGALVAAGFIGPGTVTTCTVSGASAGYTLLWAMLFSTVATIIFQEMAARLGIITQQGLGENIRARFTNPALRTLAVAIVIIAIFVGNIAYETGNLTGASMGLQAVIPNVSSQIWGPLLGICAFALLWTGSYKYIEKFLVGLVLLMSAVFIATVIASPVSVGSIFKGLFIPTMGESNLMTIVGLIGTTVVPYNLFLHASSASERWKTQGDLANARIDTIVSIGLGGIISMCIIIAAAANCQGQEIANGAAMALALEPLLGAWAKWAIAIGLFAAGFSSAITAPLSAAFASAGALGFKRDLKSMKFKVFWMIVLGVGILLTALNKSSPTELILVAQAANAIILPVMVLFLLYCTNSSDLGKYRNKWWNNALGAVILIVTLLICYRNMTSFVASLTKLLSAA